MHLVEFNLETKVFQNVYWPLNEETNELSFESNRVSIANIDDYLCVVTCAWENDAGPVLRSWILRDMKFVSKTAFVKMNTINAELLDKHLQKLNITNHIGEILVGIFYYSIFVQCLKSQICFLFCLCGTFLNK